MTGLSFNPRVIPDQSPVAEPVIDGDGFLPAIAPARIRAAHRIGEAVTPERLRAAVIGALLTVQNDLADWIAAQRAAGYATLGDVPAPQLAGESRLVLLYERAIGAETKASLIEAHRDVDQTGAGQRRTEELEPGIRELRRDAIHAVRDILGVTRTNVELL